MKRTRWPTIMVAGLAAVLFPTAALAASPYTTSTSLTSITPSACTPAPGATPVVVNGVSAALPCTFTLTTTVTTSYILHTPTTTYTSEFDGYQWQALPPTWGVISYQTVVVTPAHTAYSTVAYTAYTTGYHTFSYTTQVAVYHSAWVHWYYSCQNVGRPTCYWVWHTIHWTTYATVVHTYTVSYQVPYTAYRQVPYTVPAVTAQKAVYGWIPQGHMVVVYQLVPTGTNWSASPAGTTVSSTSVARSGFTDTTPLAGTTTPNANCGPGYCNGWYIIPIPVVTGN